MKEAYCKLNEEGYAHSITVYYDGELAGGLYGVAIGKIFFAESKFTLKNNGSKIALIALAKQLEAWGFGMIDCQFLTPHLKALGAQEIERAKFYQILNQHISKPQVQSWSFDQNLLNFSKK